MPIPGICKVVGPLVCFGILLAIVTTLVNRKREITGKNTDDKDRGIHHGQMDAVHGTNLVVSVGNKCYVLVDKKIDLGEVNAKDCPLFSIKNQTLSNSSICESVLNEDLLIQHNQAKEGFSCCWKASVCNGEGYCGEGTMQCFPMNGSVIPVCVCPKGIMGQRCELCADKKKVHCHCSAVYSILNKSQCQSVYYSKGLQCLTKHTIDGTEVPCLCESDMDEQLTDSRCSGDSTEPCAESSP